jgi:hypothetical protein
MCIFILYKKDLHMKKITLNESKLRQIIRKSIKQCLKEAIVPSNPAPDEWYDEDDEYSSDRTFDDDSELGPEYTDSGEYLIIPEVKIVFGPADSPYDDEESEEEFVSYNGNLMERYVFDEFFCEVVDNFYFDETANMEYEEKLEFMSTKPHDEIIKVIETVYNWD